MFRLLIVDDEPAVVDGLVEVFNNAVHLDLEVYGAYNAPEALSWLERTKIDIVLSDIRMPGMSGLELQKEIVQRWPRCKVIFLTGYTDFSYVQESFRNGGVDYLLKTEGDPATIHAVEKAIQTLKEELNSDDWITRAKSQLHEAIASLQKEYLWDLVQGDSYAYRMRYEQFAELKIPLDPNQPVMLVVGRVDDWRERLSPRDKALLLYAVQNIAGEYLAPLSTSVAIVFERSKLLWFLQPKQTEIQIATLEETWKRTVRFVHGMLEQVQTTCIQLLKLSLSLVAASEAVDWTHIDEKFEALKVLLSCGLGTGRELLLIEQDRIGAEITDSNNNHSVRLKMKKGELLSSYLENGQEGEYFFVYSELMKLDYIRPDLKESHKMELFHMLVYIHLSHLNRAGLYQKAGEIFDLNRFSHDQNELSWDEIIEYFRELARWMFEQRSAGQMQEEHTIVNRIKKYVEDHIAGDLSLTRIGEIVELNPSYLSRVFKQVAGIGISDFIFDKRIDQAKRLLQENKHKISDISTIMGFSSLQNFYRYFKKATLMTPQEYRDSLSK